MRVIINFSIASLLVFSVLGCSEQSGGNDDCDVVVNANGPGFLKVVNNMNERADVFLSEYAFSALLNGHSCEIYGLNIGLRKIEISICADNECKTYSTTKKTTILIEDGKTKIIELTGDYFNN